MSIDAFAIHVIILMSVGSRDEIMDSGPLNYIEIDFAVEFHVSEHIN